MEASKASTSQEEKRGKKTDINSPSRLLVQLLHCCFSKENENMEPLKPQSKVSERVVDAFRISQFTVYNCAFIVKESNNEKKRPGIDSFDETAIRNHINEYYEREEWPTRPTLVNSVSNTGFKIVKEPSLLKTLKNKWKRINKRKYLLERKDIVPTKFLFLEYLKRYDLDKIIFLGETLVDASSGKISSGEGGQLILAHAGSAKGFIQHCCLLFQSKKQGDYHQDIADIFKQWFVRLLDKLPPMSLIVMDNAPYHSIIKDISPTTAWTIKEIQDCLTKNNVKWSTSMPKGQLMDLVYLNKPTTKAYELDELAKEKGFSVIRLPPNQGRCNPIEIIWQQVKWYVTHENTTFQLNDVENLTKITSEDWKWYVQYTSTIIEEAWKKECMLEKTVEQMLIQVHESSSSLKTDSDIDADESSNEDDWDIALAEDND